MLLLHLKVLRRIQFWKQYCRESCCSTRLKELLVLAYQLFSVSPKLKGSWNFIPGERYAADFDLCVLQWIIASLPSLSLFCFDVFLPSSSVLHNYFKERISVLVISSLCLALAVLDISGTLLLRYCGRHFCSGIKLPIEKTGLDKAGGEFKGLQLFYMKFPFLLGTLFRLLPSKCESFHTGI